MSSCDETTVCSRALVNDVCMEKLTNQADSVAQCYEWANYLNCAHDVTCTCGLLDTGNDSRSDAVYVNIAKINYLLFTPPKCSDVLNDIALRVPEMLLSPDFLCFDRVTAMPKLIPVAKTLIEKAIEFDPWPSICPAVMQCATQYDQFKIDALSKKDYIAYCLTSTNLIQCTRTALCGCGLSAGPEAKALDSFLLSKYGDCSIVITLGSSDCGHIGEGGGIVADAPPAGPPSNSPPSSAPTSKSPSGMLPEQITTTKASVGGFVFGRNVGSERGRPGAELILGLIVTTMTCFLIVM
ncbi:unnamed protein product [Lymnaea stagnalis]|uniref:Uncharacterized protein n=1 Tax=Lymnaea stagnalis TaxID=6523 RepID=A0AAV2H5A5_LYMST